MCFVLIGSSLLGALAKLRKVTNSFVISVCLSVSMEQLGSHWTYFQENLYILVFIYSLWRKFESHETLARIKVTLIEYQYTGWATKM
jgi:hypothetical protein